MPSSPPPTPPFTLWEEERKAQGSICMERLRSVILAGPKDAVYTVKPLNSGTQHFVLCPLSFVQSVYTRVHLVCPLLGGLSSFGVSLTGVETATRK